MSKKVSQQKAKAAKDERQDARFWAKQARNADNKQSHDFYAQAAKKHSDRASQLSKEARDARGK